MKVRELLDRIAESLNASEEIDRPHVVLTPGQYSKKVAYRIDPLMARDVEVQQPDNRRAAHEVYSDELPKRHRGVNPYFVAALVLMALTPVLLSAPAVAQRAVAVDVGKSDIGYHVTQVQYVLRSFGYTVAIDGDFGSQTEKAVKHFQKVNNILADGVVGPVTQNAMGLELGAPVTVTQPARRVTPPPPHVDPAPADQGSVEQIIRDVWSDDAEDRAVAIAFRESRFVPTAANSCCYGIFQIHFRAHHAWLADYGVNQPSDLFDPRTNATVALALYQQAGWTPWNL